MATCSTDVSLSLKCSVCLELYTDPRVLPCLHTFCLHCLEPLVKNNRLTCPQCRGEHSIPKDGVSMYPVDLSLLPELGEAKEEKKICGSCTSGDVAVGYCTDCGEFLCEWCRDTSHKRNKAFLSHTLVSLEDAPGFPSSTREQHSYCDMHTDHKLEVYCRSCYAIACLVCTLGSQRTRNHTHNYSLIEDSGNRLMTKIQESTKNVETKEKDLQIKLDCIEELEAVMRERQSEVESRITATCDEWISALQERKEQLLSEVDDIFTKHSKKIWSAKNDIVTLLLQLKSCRSFSLRYQKQGHLLSLTNQLIKNLEKSEAAKIKLDHMNELLLSHTLFTKSVLREKPLGTLSSKETNKLNLEGKLVLKDSNDQLREIKLMAL